MNRSYTCLVGLTTLLFVAACEDDPIPTGLSPELAISDAVHDDGNEHFFFLPPMVPDPSPAGTFTGDAEPVVEICVWDGSECGAGLEFYTTETGPGSETIRIDLAAEHYIVNWHTDDILENSPIDQAAGDSYRIRVLVGAQLLGYADVQVVDNGRQLRNVDTDEYIPLLDGRTLPIKFRIEEGFEAPPNLGVSAGFIATCALNAEGDAYCWGHNGQGQLGTGTVYSGVLSTPQLVTGGHKFSSVSTSGYHSCGITLEGDAYCWGNRYRGQLGDGTSGLPQTQPTPVLVAGGRTFASIATGHQHTCGVTTDGEGYCWGTSYLGQLGNGTLAATNPTPLPVGGGHTFQSIHTKRHHTCGVTTAGAAYCWGYNFYGAIGDGSTSHSRPNPTAVVGGHTFASLRAGNHVTCGITTGGTTYCWGQNAAGQVGDGTFTTTSPYAKPNPTMVTGGHSFESISPGNDLTCAVAMGGAAYCWGNNVFGGLGNGTTGGLQASPVPVSGGHTFTSVNVGWVYACGVTTDPGVYCWGNNLFGQLGDGTVTHRAAPVFTLALDPTSP